MNTRRAFLARGGTLLGTSLVMSLGASTRGSVLANPAEDDVSPAEDLMREHGVLKRVMLVYDEIASRLGAGTDVPPETLRGGAEIIRTFIEQYHEKLEEDHLFPRFEQAHTLTDLVATLRLQHQRGRLITDKILALATAPTMRSANQRQVVVGLLRAFNRMYAPHEAREDTVLFPAFRRLVSPREYDALGDDFERKEHELFGEEGFERYVESVAGLERTLGIYDLATFTPGGA